jgi:hypothetical protein
MLLILLSHQVNHIVDFCQDQRVFLAVNVVVQVQELLNALVRNVPFANLA